MPERGALVGSWTHAHEEDHGDVQVFRPSSHDFPPSRGRTSLTLRADSTAVGGLPGPTDRGDTTGDGTWELEDAVLRVHLPGWHATYEVATVDSDHLELRPL
jgi:hypothetical protein